MQLYFSQSLDSFFGGGGNRPFLASIILAIPAITKNAAKEYPTIVMELDISRQDDSMERRVRARAAAAAAAAAATGGASDKKDRLYLHVAPCGDYWTGHEVFAAKHLNPDYVKSIPVPLKVAPEGGDAGDIEYEFDPEEILQGYDGDLDQLLKKVYDTGDISLIHQLRHD